MTICFDVDKDCVKIRRDSVLSELRRELRQAKKRYKDNEEFMRTRDRWEWGFAQNVSEAERRNINEIEKSIPLVESKKSGEMGDYIYICPFAKGWV